MSELGLSQSFEDAGCSDRDRSVGQLYDRWSDQQLIDWLHAATSQLDIKFSRTDASIAELSAASADLDARTQNTTAQLHMLAQSIFIEQVF